jgi:hypothetical protein
MTIDLTDEQTEALIRALSQIIENDRYPLSPRIKVLKVRHYEPPSKGRYDRRN